MAAKEALRYRLRVFWRREGSLHTPQPRQAHSRGLSECLLTWFGATRRKIHRNTATSASWDSDPSRVGAVPSADTAALPSPAGSVSRAALGRGQAHRCGMHTGLSSDRGSALTVLFVQERSEQLVGARPCAGGTTMAQARPLLSVCSQSTREPRQ